jgi:hypothetical protein
MNNIIENLIVKLSDDPFNPEINFDCAVEYEKLNQTASAISFYLRCAEYGYETHKTLTYNSLLKMARCFEDQSDRHYTVSNCILQAMTVLPDRPEAYFMLSQFHEKSQAWQECYTYAELGLNKNKIKKLPAGIGYDQECSLNFQKAVAAWWIGRRDESIEIFNLLLKTNISELYRKAILNNLERIK